MNKRAMQMLERAFVAEVEGGLGLLQTKSRVAELLNKDGYLMEAEETLGGRFPVVVRGYRLTHLGRLTYCAACE